MLYTALIMVFYTAWYCFIVLYTYWHCFIVLYTAIELYTALYCLLVLYTALHCFVLLTCALHCFTLLYTALYNVRLLTPSICCCTDLFISAVVSLHILWNIDCTAITRLHGHRSHNFYFKAFSLMPLGHISQGDKKRDNLCVAHGPMAPPRG